MTKGKELLTMCHNTECKEKKCCNTIAVVMAVIGVIAVVAGVAFAVYKFITNNKKTEEKIDADDYFEDEESCIELEFVYPEDDEVVPVEAQTEEEE